MMREGEERSRSQARDLRDRMTDAERQLWSRLRRKQLGGFHFRRQHPIGPYIADFACALVKLVVELDGETHWRPNEVERDRRRTAYIEGRGWVVMRVHNSAVYGNLSGVLDSVYEMLVALQQGRDLAPPLAGELSAKLTEGGSRSARPPSVGHSAATSPARGGGKKPASPCNDDARYLAPPLAGELSAKRTEGGAA